MLTSFPRLCRWVEVAEEEKNKADEPCQTSSSAATELVPIPWRHCVLLHYWSGNRLQIFPRFSWQKVRELKRGGGSCCQPGVFCHRITLIGIFNIFLIPEARGLRVYQDPISDQSCGRRLSRWLWSVPCLQPLRLLAACYSYGLNGSRFLTNYSRFDVTDGDSRRCTG